MKLLITGANGFIGSHFVPFFKREGFDVQVLGRGDSAAEVCKRVSPEFVIHLAARAVPGRDLSELLPQIEDTIRPSISLAEAIPSSCRLALFFGSSDEYGEGPVPFREDQSVKPLSPYGWAKHSAHQAVRMIAEQKGLPLCWARPSLIFGPGQRSNAVVPSLLRACLAGEAIALTPGEQTRDFLFVEDLGAMVLAILKNPARAAGQVVNLCSSQPRTIRSVAETVRRICGRGELKFGAIPYRENEIMSFYGSNEKFKSLFGEPRLTPIEKALQKTVEAERAAR